jgi:hypothetical protein
MSVDRRQLWSYRVRLGCARSLLSSIGALFFAFFERRSEALAVIRPGRLRRMSTSNVWLNASVSTAWVGPAIGIVPIALDDAGCTPRAQSDDLEKRQ